ncbi:thioredoxin-like protein [Suhomyces tanzawaensis NRRL Y-17324]|uniref:Thioredoxin-like protein n=1 Tax=Suhomyces tanzawaensis NRRL Y-17324 TaxID=984487 RepID=A0A1E4SB17_9ASCO|nr:thioredoxin-like protein [Suhomyces tanzawaensis NRRL Y-17324]ODV76699.1 thioredoxin-like protein [Suhomyces tanzawaensis NRRL Y-17324]
MDQQISQLVEGYQESKLRHLNDPDNESSDDDELLELLEDDDVLSRYRDERIQQLTKELKKIDDVVADTNDEELGRVVNILDEKELMNIVTQNELVIIHFYQPNFQRCKIMNERLAQVAEKHLTLKILRITAESAPFLVTKLGIKVLPFVVIYKKGKELTRTVGFEKFGNDPNTFPVEALERFLIMHNVINRRTINFGSIRSKPQKAEDDDDDLDI